MIIQADQVASIARDPEGSTTSTRPMAARPPAGRPGAVLGVAVRMLFFIPFFGVGCGRRRGRACGHFGEKGIDKAFQDQVRESCKPGTSALFLMIEHSSPEKAIAALQQYGGTVIKTSLSEEDTKKLQEALSPVTDGGRFVELGGTRSAAADFRADAARSGRIDRDASKGCRSGERRAPARPLVPSTGLMTAVQAAGWSRLFQCAREDSNLHGPFSPQGPQPQSPRVDGFSGVRGPQIMRFSERIGPPGKVGCCHECCHKSHRLVSHNGFRIMNVFLKISKEEQRNRFLRRLDLPDHNWKFSTADARERERRRTTRTRSRRCSRARVRNGRPGM